MKPEIFVKTALLHQQGPPQTCWFFGVGVYMYTIIFNDCTVSGHAPITVKQISFYFTFNFSSCISDVFVLLLGLLEGFPFTTPLLSMLLKKKKALLI